MSSQDEGHLLPGRSPRTSVLGVAAPNMQPATRAAVHEVHPAEVEESQYQDPTSIDIESSLTDLSARQELIVSRARSADPAGFNLVVGGGETHVEGLLGPSSVGSAFGLSSLDAALPTPTTPTSQPLRSTASGSLWQNGMSSPSMDGANAPRSPRGANSNISGARTGAQRMRDAEIGLLGELYIVEVLRQHIHAINPLIHWTSKLRRHAGLPGYLDAEITDVAFPDNLGHLSKLLLSWSRDEMPPR
jgi:hypothetical protein